MFRASSLLFPVRSREEGRLILSWTFRRGQTHDLQPKNRYLKFTIIHRVRVELESINKQLLIEIFWALFYFIKAYSCGLISSPLLVSSVDSGPVQPVQHSTHPLAHIDSFWIMVLVLSFYFYSYLLSQAALSQSPARFYTCSYTHFPIHACLSRPLNQTFSSLL